MIEKEREGGGGNGEKCGRRPLGGQTKRKMCEDDDIGNKARPITVD